MRHAAIATLTVILSGTIGPVLAAPPWVRVETPNFVVFGEIGEKRTAAVAMEFERFREALIRILPRASSRAPVPTLVFVFGSNKSFKPYYPRQNGKPVEVGGYFSPGEYHSLITVNMQNRDYGRQTVFHEYAHLLIANAAGRVPAWLNEGLAEFYGTFQVTEGGRAAAIGAPIVHHLRLLNSTALIPLDELLKVESAGAEEKERRSLFYAQSWALVHMLVTSQPSRSPDLARYTSMVRSGADSVSAWREVFGNLDAVGEIKGHVRRRILSSIGVQFSTELPAVRGLVASATSSEVHTVLGAFQSWMESDSYGSPFLPVNEEGATSLALAVRGLVEVANDLRPEGESRLLSIDSGSEDWLAQYFVACGLTRLMSLVVSDEPSALAQPALSAIKTVLEARPALPHALAMKARALLASPEGREAAAEAIREAQALAPHRPDYAFLAADVHVRRRDYPAARAALGPFLSSIAAPEVRESARRLMTYVLDAEQRENAWKAAGAEQHQRVHGLDEPPPRSIPVYRELRNGEQRVAGELHRIECTPKVTTLHVTVDGRPLRFIGGRMDTIEFVTYRNDQTGEVACARRVPPDSVLVTFATTQVKGSSGFPIAVEFLPTSR